MPQLHLPEDHSNADLVLAGQIAASVNSGQLFVAWTHRGGPGAHPRIWAELREPAHPIAGLLGFLLDSAGDVLRALLPPGGERRRAA